jgi:hypothetical protein
MKLVYNKPDQRVKISELIPTAIFQVGDDRLFMTIKRGSRWLRGDNCSVYGIDLATGEIVQFAPDAKVTHLSSAEIHI